jgi:mRNA interferase MazF
MDRCRAGDIILLFFPFTSAEGAKRRPALILLDVGDTDVVVARVTSQAVRSVYDVEISEWREAGLRLPSVVRIHKIATFEKTLIERKLGALSTSDWSRVKERLQQLWGFVSG